MKLGCWLLAFLVTFFCCDLNSFSCGHSYLNVRSQVGCFDSSFITDLSIKKKCKHVNFFSLVPSYARSFRSSKLACYFFGGSALTFSGSRVEDRKKTDILADYFGLPSDFVSNVSFCPLIQDVSLNLRSVLDLSWIHDRLYLSISAPLVHTRRDLRMCEHISKKGESFSPAGYFSGGNQRLERGQLVSDVATSFRGISTFGDMQEPLRFGKIDCSRKQTGIADLRFALDYDFYDRKDYKVGGNLFFVCPTGTKPTAEFLFEPVIGNGHHWAFGFGGRGVWRFNKNEKAETEWRAFGAFELSHLVRSFQRRSFDLKNNGYGSRYMLLSVFDRIRDNLLQVPEGTTPAKQYVGHLVPAINKTTFDCKVSVGIQADFLIGLLYKRGPWEVNVSYNLWGHSREKIQRCEGLAGGKYAPKGDAQLYGFFEAQDAGGGLTYELPLPLNVTQSKATLYSGQGEGNPNFINVNVDNPVAAAVKNTVDVTLNQLTADDLSGIVPGTPFGSNPPVFLSDSDIDECSAQSPRAFSSRLSAQCSYSFDEKDNYIPRVSAGLQVEVGHSCAAVSSWKFWMGGEIKCW